VPHEPLVLNEWLLHDLQGENGTERQVQSGEFLKALRRGSDHIIVVRDTPWVRKAYALMRESTPAVRILSQFLFLGILLDSAKTRYLELDELQSLPAELAGEAPQSDAYLLQAAIATGSKIVVTTDQKLIDRVPSAAAIGIRLEHRDEFLVRYVAAIRV
jgi:hypothetical protein